MKKSFLILTLIFLFNSLNAQLDGFSGINFQLNLNLQDESDLDLRFLIIDNSDDTLWEELHDNLVVNNDHVVNFVLGNGTYLSGSNVNFHEINFLDSDRIEIWRVDGTGDYLISTLFISSIPYAYYSKYLLYTPLTSDLADFNSGTNNIGNLIKFDGISFSGQSDIVADTALFADVSESANFADTANVVIVNYTLVDSSFYSVNSNHVLASDTTFYSLNTDTSDFATYFTGTVDYAFNNWSITGNDNIGGLAFLGTTDTTFAIKTNNNKRLTFSQQSIYNVVENIGFSFQTKAGFLARPSTAPGLDLIPGSFMYFDGSKSAFAGGQHNLGMDTAMLIGSFTWGENISANGKYALMFGKNITADSSNQSGIWYAPDASFAMGQNVVAGQYCIGFGENVQSNYTRNVAIGKNVQAGIFSSSIAIGIDVICTGSTSWAVGRNLNATGHFATLTGYNVSTGTYKGGFLFGDNSATLAQHTANHQFMVRASGGYIFYSSSDLTTGVELLSGAGSWNMLSDKNKKENITVLSSAEYYSLFKDISVFSWTYKEQTQIHIGPMAQDFYSIFKIGEYSNYINMLDIDGVTLLGIKMLNSELKKIEPEDFSSKITNQIQSENHAIDSLEIRINKLYEKINN